MKYKIKLIFLLLWGPLYLAAQPLNMQKKYDLNKDKVLFTVGYSHLDSEWNWDYVATINEYIRNIMTENFYLMEKYPEYVFNFTGSRRYGMMKEYYPDLYPKVVELIKQGRWHVSGSSVDEGEVNVSSSESVIRQVLYGNLFFKKEFGKTSADYMLPDCFGFVASLPSVWNHCGLLGFSTQKLTWRSANGVPFNMGLWSGPDGKGVIAALNATNYVGDIKPRLDIDTSWIRRLNDDQNKYGISFDYRYYGVGDQGGAPRENDVFNAVNSLNNPDSKIKVILSSSDQIYKEITPELRKKLPTFSGDLLLIEHSAGSMTSQSYMKRLNRKNELLAQASEQLAVAADWLGASPYPHQKLNNAWELVLGSQFHDILPGTSIPKAYEYAWNDEFIAANSFAEVMKHSVEVLSSKLNTNGNGRPIVVYNPVAMNREDVVAAEMEYQNLPDQIQVFDGRGKALLTQIISREGNKLKFIFLAKVPSSGLAVFDVREGSAAKSRSSELTINNNTLENTYYRIKVAENGDITSIYDKKASRELLAQPAKLEFLHEAPSAWPAWNMDWKDRQKPPIDFMDKNAAISVLEQGPVRVSLEIRRHGMNSDIVQIVSLSAGEAGKRVEVNNKVDWQSKGVSLKASFPLTVSNEMATYNLGVGTIQRSNNNSSKFEVPAKEWFDLTDKSGKYGISILEDCKYGSDKPADNTLRLTLLYTPEARSFKYQDTQDWGIHDFKYGIYGHQGSWAESLSPWQAKFLNQPLLAFETSKHEGSLGKELSLVTASSPQVGLMAFKKMEENDYYLIRVNELSGKDLKNTALSFPGKIVDAYEVNGQEQKIGFAVFSGNKLNFDLTHYTIRSFAVKLEPVISGKIRQYSVELPFNQDVVSYDSNRADGIFSRRGSLPGELLPDTIESEGIIFELGDKADRKNNALGCKGQEISLPEGDFNTLYILAAAREDTRGEFRVANREYVLGIQKWSDYIGQFYNRDFSKDGITVTGIKPPFVKQNNIAWFASHYHLAYPSANNTYQYCYLYKYRLDVPEGARNVKLPNNDHIKILAITAAKARGGEIRPLQPIFDDFKQSKNVSLRKN